MKMILDKNEITEMIAEYIKYSYGIDFEKISIEQLEACDWEDKKIVLDEIIVSMEKL